MGPEAVNGGATSRQGAGDGHRFMPSFWLGLALLCGAMPLILGVTIFLIWR